MVKSPQNTVLQKHLHLHDKQFPIIGKQTPAIHFHGCLGLDPDEQILYTETQYVELTELCVTKLYAIGFSFSRNGKVIFAFEDQ